MKITEKQRRCFEQKNFNKILEKLKSGVGVKKTNGDVYIVIDSLKNGSFGMGVDSYAYLDELVWDIEYIFCVYSPNSAKDIFRDVANYEIIWVFEKEYNKSKEFKIEWFIKKIKGMKK